MKNIITILALFVGLSFFVSCNSGNKSADVKKVVIDKTTAKEYASMYICPMHCEGSGSDKMGTCPVCKMDYELNENFKKADDGHNHDGHNHEGHDHSGHDHGSHEGHNH